MKHLPLKAVLLAILCNVIFGSAMPMIKFGYEWFSITDDMFAKILFAGVRFFVSGVFVLLIAGVRRRTFPTMPKGTRMTIVSIALTYTFLQYIFNYIGLSNTGGALSTVIVSSSSFMSVILAHFIYQNDRLNLRKIGGCIVGCAGVVLATMVGKEIGDVSFFGEGFLLISAGFFVIGSALIKRVAPHIDGFTITAYNLLIGGGLLVLTAMIGYRGGITVTWQGALILLYLIAVSSVGFTMWSVLLSKYPMGKLGVFLFIIPVSGAILSGLILREDVFTLPYLLAFILVSVGIILVNKKRTNDK